MAEGKLVILRHGQTEYNIKRLMTGRADIPLTALGEEQAREAGLLMKGIPFAKVYSSPLSRAFNTASLALKAAGQNIAIEKNSAIIEADAGTFTGRSIDHDPDVLKFTHGYAEPMPGGGESDKQVVARTLKFFNDEILPALKRGENVLLVCHSGTMHALDVTLGIKPAPADNVKLEASRIPNASPLVCNYKDGVLTNRYYMQNPKVANQNTVTPKNTRKFKP